MADAKSIKHLEASDLFEIGEGMPPEALEDINAYLHTFGPFRNDDGTHVCLNCGKEVDGLKQALGLAVAYEWGLAHGEASCSGCGWPARGMHYVKNRDGEELITLRNVFLPYHPDFVSSGEELDAAQ